MKRAVILLAVLLLMVSSVGCGHEHTWSEATCTQPRTCSGCGKTDGEALGHQWEEATCVDSKTCLVCGATEGEPLGHDWIDATHETPKTCSRCGETEGGVLLYDVPQSFYDDHIFADFPKFNSTAEENGLGDTMVWLEGSYDKINTLDMPEVEVGLQLFLAFFTDADNNIWLIELDSNNLNSIEKYENLAGHTLFITARYEGFSLVYNTPALLVERVFDRTTGDIIVPGLYEYSS